MSYIFYSTVKIRTIYRHSLGCFGWSLLTPYSIGFSRLWVRSFRKSSHKIFGCPFSFNVSVGLNCLRFVFGMSLEGSINVNSFAMELCKRWFLSETHAKQPMTNNMTDDELFYNIQLPVACVWRRVGMCVTFGPLDRNANPKCWNEEPAATPRISRHFTPKSCEWTVSQASIPNHWKGIRQRELVHNIHSYVRLVSWRCTKLHEFKVPKLFREPRQNSRNNTTKKTKTTPNPRKLARNPKQTNQTKTNHQSCFVESPLQPAFHFFSKRLQDILWYPARNGPVVGHKPPATAGRFGSSRYRVVITPKKLRCLLHIHFKTMKTP